MLNWERAAAPPVRQSYILNKTGQSYLPMFLTEKPLISQSPPAHLQLYDSTNNLTRF